MQKFTLTCPDGYTKDFMANSSDEAVTMALNDEEVKAHVTKEHPEEASKTPEEMKQMVAGMMKPAMAM